MVRITPINNAEAFFLPFWDDELSPLPRFEQRTCANSDGFKQGWCCAQLSWIKSEPNQRLGTLYGNLDLDVSEYDQLILMASLPKSTVLTVQVRVDGGMQTPISEARGIDNEEEYVGKLRGRHMESISIAIDAREIGGMGSLYILWAGLAHAARLKYMLDHAPRYSPDWKGLLVPEDENIRFEPERSLFFSSDQLEHLRLKVQNPPYKQYIQRMREQTSRLMRDSPENVIGRYVSRGGAYQFTRMRDRKTAPMIGARICSFLGLLDRDIPMLRYAARCALACAHCDTWATSPMEDFPGSRFHHRSFFEAGYTMGCLFALDWAGNVLTNRAKKLIRHAVCLKGLPQIQKDFWEFEYIWHCNQGPTFAAAWLMALIAFAREWPRVKPSMPLAEQTLRESILNGISEDGGTVEGPGYGGTVARVEALYAYARYQGISFRDYIRKTMPDKYFKAKDFFLAFLRNGDDIPAGSYYTICDSGGHARHAVGMMVLYAEAMDDPSLQSIAWDLICDPPEGDEFFNLEDVLVPVLGPDSQPAKKPKLPVFSRFPEVGQITSSRDSTLGLVRFFLVGGKAHAGHNHEDKGSFFLDVGGEALACDRGMVEYSHPQTAFLKSASAHNLLIPMIQGRVYSRQLNPCPHTITPEGHGDENTFSARVDTTLAWNGLFRSHIRSVESESPIRFVITDAVVFNTPTSVSFNLHSVFEIKPVTNGWLVKGEKTALAIIPCWDYEEADVFEESVNNLYKPVNHLSIKSTPIRKGELVTEFEIVPKDSADITEFGTATREKT